jgi:hypothetical protein
MITNIKELRNDLLESDDKTKKGDMAVSLASQLSNTAGRIISATALEMQYKRNKGDNTKIPFLETNY